ncbi:MAG: ferredoxin family protein [Candidatus Sabulitectum sp.]|nr:ferredoxin family protein [Candidatus Sabulitectum sp.]
MIKVFIDEDACVGCALCVDECPTDVFEFDEEKNLPLVKRENECFGCFSCSEVCPAEAITHEGAELSSNFYHDSYALDLAAKLTPGTVKATDVSDEAELQKALDDLGIRLLSIAAVFRQTLGGSMPAVGTMAGRTLANQLPRYRKPESFQEALEMASSQFSPSWDLNFSVEGDQLTVTTKTCFIRDLCEKEGIDLGGDLCVLFYNNLAGYLGKMGGLRLKLESMEPGSSECIYKVKKFEPIKI